MRRHALAFDDPASAARCVSAFDDAFVTHWASSASLSRHAALRTSIPVLGGCDTCLSE